MSHVYCSRPVTLAISSFREKSCPTRLSFSFDVLVFIPPLNSSTYLRFTHYPYSLITSYPLPTPHSSLLTLASKPIADR